MRSDDDAPRVDVTRRDLLRGVSGLALFRGAAGLEAALGAQAGPTPLVIGALNHVTLTVTDPKRSLAFYQKVFGFPVVAMQGPVPIMRIGAGPQFLALSGGPKATPRIDHFCLTVDAFDATRLMTALESRGIGPAAAGDRPAVGALAGGPLKARIRMRGTDAGGAPEGTPELYIGDPDGLVVQLQAVDYCGGAGVTGGLCASAPRSSGAPLVARDMNHVTLQAADPKRSLEFYQRVFGMPVAAAQGTTQILRVGAGPAFVAISGSPAKTPRIDHVCLTVERFDVNHIMSALANLGITRVDQVPPSGAAPLTSRLRMRGADAGGAPEGTPELYFTDPDGISIQLQDPTYCGGSGVLGQVCTR